MKHKQPKAIGLRSTEKDRIRRIGMWRMIVLVACAAVLATAVITAIIRIGSDVPVDPNAHKHAPGSTR
jgi:hypothetical protein